MTTFTSSLPTSSSQQHAVIRASAGSGKTFALSSRYLKLLLAGGPADTILATTFTRKAAGEILQRILLRLGKAATDSDQRQQLAEALFPNEGRSFTDDEIQALLHRLIRHLHRLRVSTLDSFFIQLAGNFSLELGLPPGWTISEEIENKRLVNTAIQDSFERMGTSVAIQLMNLLHKGQLPVKLTEELDKLITPLLAICRKTEESVWKKVPREKVSESAILDILASLETAIVPLTKKGTSDQRFENAKKKMVESAKTEDWSKIVNTKLPLAVHSENYLFSSIDFSSCSGLISAVQELLLHIRTIRLNEIADQTEATAKVLSAVTHSYYSLKAEQGIYRFDDVTAVLADSCCTNQQGEVAYRLDADIRHLLLDEFQDTSFDQWAVLKPLVDKIIHQANNTSFFCVGDVKQAIYGWRGGLSAIFNTVSSLPGVQEESLDQNWRSSPIIIELVNLVFKHLSTNSVFIPNDKEKKPYDIRKQLIAQEVAEQWSEQFPFHQCAARNKDLSGYCTLEEAPLYDKDSPPWVPKFMQATNSNSSLFDSDSDHWDESFDLDLEEEDTSLDEEESPITPSANKYLIGYAVDRIIEIHQANPNASMGILLRTNAMIGKVVALLRQQGLEVSEEGGNLLTDAASVEIILAALKLADHPGDTVALFCVQNVQPLAEFLTKSTNELYLNGPLVSLWLRESIATHSLGAIIEEMATCLHPLCDLRERQKMKKLIELAYLYQGPRDRIDDFIEFIRNNKVSAPASTKIQVMTIHKAKGLEFEIVVLPELDGDMLSSSKQKIFFERDPQTQEITTALYRVNNDDQIFLSDSLKKIFDENNRRLLEESLCLLYVAMTRAVRHLVMIVPAKKKPEYNSLKWGHLLRNALASPENSSFEIIYSAGTADWYQEKVKATFADVPLRDFSLIETMGTSVPSLASNVLKPIFQQLSILQVPYFMEDAGETPAFPGGFENRPTFSQRNPFYFLDSQQHVVEQRERPSQKDDIRWKPHSVFQRGSALHRCFEFVRWLDIDGLPDRTLLKEVLGPILFQEQKIEEITNEFYRLCQLPNIRNALSLGSLQQSGESPVSAVKDADRKWIVEKERKYVKHHHGVLSKGYIDRLVLLCENGKVIGAEIIDYKTDQALLNEKGFGIKKQLSSQTVKKLFPDYCRQLKEYEKMVREWYHLSSAQVSKKLLFVTHDLVVDVND